MLFEVENKELGFVIGYDVFEFDIFGVVFSLN